MLRVWVATYQIRHVRVPVLVQREPLSFRCVPQHVAHGFRDRHFAGGGRARGAAAAAGG